MKPVVEVLETAGATAATRVVGMRAVQVATVVGTVASAVAGCTRPSHPQTAG